MASDADGWVARLHDIERRLLDALFATNRNLANYKIAVESIATVDVRGMCLYASPFSQTALGLLSVLKGGYIHIGVGSDVVCSIPIGNARASIRGTDNSEGSTSFLCPFAKEMAP